MTRTSLALLAAVLLVAGCTKSSEPAVAKVKAEPLAQAPEANASVEDRTVLAVSKAIRKNHLTDLEDECLAYQFDASSVKDAYLVDVRENHRLAKCGGDPDTSPRLFSVRVAKSDGSMSTDRGSPSGEYRPISR
jgi:hypothetical protein